MSLGVGSPMYAQAVLCQYFEVFFVLEKQHEVITFRHLNAMISDVTMPKKYCRVSRTKQTKEKPL